MADIWNRVISVGGVISAENARVTFGSSNAGLLVNQVKISGQRDIGQLMDLKTGNIYLISGLPRLFQIALVGVVADAASYKSFVASYGNACNTNSDLTITVTPGLCTTSSASTITYTVSRPILTAVDDTVSGENYVFMGTCVLVSPSVSVT